MSKKRHGLLTRLELAAKICFSPRAISGWQTEGLPVARKGRGGRPTLFSLRAVRAWLSMREQEQHHGAVGQVRYERARKEAAQANLMNQTYLVRVRDLLPRDEVEKVWATTVANVRATLLFMPLDLPDRLHGACERGDWATVRRQLHEALQPALAELEESSKKDWRTT